MPISRTPRSHWSNMATEHLPVPVKYANRRKDSWRTAAGCDRRGRTIGVGIYDRYDRLVEIMSEPSSVLASSVVDGNEQSGLSCSAFRLVHILVVDDSRDGA